MGGEVLFLVVIGSRGGVKILGLVFEDLHEGCYHSGEMVARHVLLEVCKPVALCALRFEVQCQAAALEVEYPKVCLSLCESVAYEGVIFFTARKT
ncbi:Arrestin domain-containing protein 4 [Heterocephalus glaber]|uniref:Arrestin domain-containing protein 4 n=1 Tax=Heterocephalus glaber TaxID=10181 RepID=G5AZW9_HETGA|nr:Arrestin domain-containing protein 4 [Heterocephalus glaber]